MKLFFAICIKTCFSNTQLPNQFLLFITVVRIKKKNILRETEKC